MRPPTANCRPDYFYLFIILELREQSSLEMNALLVAVLMTLHCAAAIDKDEFSEEDFRKYQEEREEKERPGDSFYVRP